jgi:NADH-quinone oxidoreductase subunit J
LNQAFVYLVYAVFAVGGAGVYFALPKPGRSTKVAGAVLGLAAVAMLIVLLATTIAEPVRYAVFSYLFAAIALLGAGRVITHPKPVYSALYFVLVVVAVAFLIVLQQAEFLGIALIIVYAGAILVTYAFVIMLAQQSGASAYDTRSREPFWAVLGGFLVCATICANMAKVPITSTPAEPPVQLASAQAEPRQAKIHQIKNEPVPLEEVSNTVAVGESLMTQYVVTLEVAGLLLLAALVGAVAISRKRVPSEDSPADETPLGQAGREALPF